jgi:hypothetical protein
MLRMGKAVIVVLLLALLGGCGCLDVPYIPCL